MTKIYLQAAMKTSISQVLLITSENGIASYGNEKIKHQIWLLVQAIKTLSFTGIKYWLHINTPNEHSVDAAVLPHQHEWDHSSFFLQPNLACKYNWPLKNVKVQTKMK